MNVKRGLLLMGCTLLLMAAVFKPGYRIIVDDRPLSGVYAPEVARAAAAELSADVPFQLIPVLCREYRDADEAQLCSLLLKAHGASTY